MKHFFRYWFPLLAWMILIFVMSHQDGQSSAKTSEWFLQLLKWLHIDPEQIKGLNMRLLIRKAAHMTEYFILYFLAFRLCKQYKPLSTAFWLALVIAVLYAASDEFHQIFIPGRVGTIFDVGIDSLGALIALILCRKYQDRRAKI